MSVCNNIENDKLTTDAVPEAPRDNIETENLVIEEPNKEENNKANVHYSINSKKKPTTGNGSTSGKSYKKSSNGFAKPSHTCTKVINVSNSNSVHIGSIHNYNLFSNLHKHKKNIIRNAAVDKIIASNELVKSEHINFISTHLGEGWRDVGENLGYSRGQMDNFYIDNKTAGHKEVVYQMLLDWTQVNPDDCKIGILATALWDADQRDLVCSWIKNF